MPIENKFSSDFFDNDESPRAKRLRAMADQTPRDRIAALTERQSEPAVCNHCGSTWFYETEFNQYRSGTYSSAPGGELEVINAMPMRIRICACGKPYRPNIGGAFHGGRTPNEQMGSFQASLEKAIVSIEARMSSVGVTALLETTLNQIIGPYDVRITSIERSLTSTEPAAATPAPPAVDPEEPKPAKKSAK